MDFGTLFWLICGFFVFISAGAFFRAYVTQGKKAGHNQFTVKLLPMPPSKSSKDEDKKASEPLNSKNLRK